MITVNHAPTPCSRLSARLTQHQDVKMTHWLVMQKPHSTTVVTQPVLALGVVLWEGPSIWVLLRELKKKWSTALGPSQKVHRSQVNEQNSFFFFKRLKDFFDLTLIVKFILGEVWFTQKKTHVRFFRVFCRHTGLRIEAWPLQAFVRLGERRDGIWSETNFVCLAGVAKA